MPDFRTLDGAAVAGRRVLIRVDLNVPMEGGRVTDDTRIARVAPTIAELAEKTAKVVVLSHLGRPGGKVVPDLSLAALVEPLVPIGEISAPPHVFAWRPHPGAAAYRVRILAVDGAVLWTATADGTEVPGPGSALRLRPAVRYNWSVEALATDGAVLAGSASVWFRIAPDAAPSKR